MALVEVVWNPPRRTLRQFGLIGLAGFSLFAVLCYWRPFKPFAYVPESAAAEVGVAWAILAAYCFISAFAAPRGLLPIYVVLTAITLPIAIVVSLIVMVVVFYVVLTPVGLIFKLIGRDAMNRKFDPQAATYWIKRTPPATVKRYFRQF